MEMAAATPNMLERLPYPPSVRRSNRKEPADGPLYPTATLRGGRFAPQPYVSTSSFYFDRFKEKLMGIFSRTRDIIAANVTDMIERAEDPAKLIRVIILEMEETLVEVRASAARTIADQKEMRRHINRLEKLQADWLEKAQLALSKDREDLAKAALIEKQKAEELAEQLSTEVAVLDESLRASEADIAKLQSKLRDARSRQNTLAARLESAENRIKLRQAFGSEKTKDALSRFEIIERQVDLAEGQADALSLGNGSKTLDEEIAELASHDKVTAELEALKKAQAKKG